MPEIVLPKGATLVSKDSGIVLPKGATLVKSNNPSVVGSQQIDPTAGMPAPINVADVLNNPPQPKPAPVVQAPVSPEAQPLTSPIKQFDLTDEQPVSTSTHPEFDKTNNETLKEVTTKVNETLKEVTTKVPQTGIEGFMDVNKYNAINKSIEDINKSMPNVVGGGMTAQLEKEKLAVMSPLGMQLITDGLAVSKVDNPLEGNALQKKIDNNIPFTPYEKYDLETKGFNYAIENKTKEINLLEQSVSQKKSAIDLLEKNYNLIKSEITPEEVSTIEAYEKSFTELNGLADQLNAMVKTVNPEDPEAVSKYEEAYNIYQTKYNEVASVEPEAKKIYSEYKGLSDVADKYNAALNEYNKDPEIQKLNKAVDEYQILGDYGANMMNAHPEVKTAYNEQLKINTEYAAIQQVGGIPYIGKTVADSYMSLVSTTLGLLGSTANTADAFSEKISQLTGLESNNFFEKVSDKLTDASAKGLSIVPQQEQPIEEKDIIGGFKKNELIAYTNKFIGVLPVIAAFTLGTKGFGSAIASRLGGLTEATGFGGATGLGGVSAGAVPSLEGISNIGGMIATTTALGFGDRRDAAIKAGLSRSNADMYAMNSSIVEGLVFSMMQPLLHKAVGGLFSASDGAFASGLKEINKSLVNGKVPTSVIKNVTKSFAKSAVDNAVAATGMSLVEVGDYLSKELTDLTSGDGKKFNAELDPTHLAMSFVDAFITFAPIAALGAKGQIDRTNELNNYVKLSVASNPEYHKSELKNKLDKGEINQKKYDEVVQFIDDSVLGLSKIPKETDAITKSKLLPIAMEKNKLEQIKSGVDKEYHPAIDRQIKELNNEIVSVLNNKLKSDVTKGMVSGDDSFIVTDNNFAKLDIESELVGDGTKEVLEQGKNLAKVMGKKSAGTVFHKTQDSFTDVWLARGGEKAKSRNEGFYDKDTNLIHINLEVAKNDLIFHEGGHNIIAPFLKANPKFAEQKYNDLVAILEAKAKAGGENSVEAKKIIKDLNQFAEQYVKRNKAGEIISEDYEGAKSEEPLVQFFNKLAIGEYKDIFDKPENKGILDSIKEWISSVLKSIGLDAGKIKLDSGADVISFARKMSDAFKQGKEVKLKGDVESIKTESPVEVVTPKDLKAKIVGAFDKIGFEESEDYQKLKESGHINEDYDLKKSAGKPVVVINPDTMMTGRITTPSGKKIVEGNGGLHFVSKFGDVWASSDITTASVLKNNINTAIKKDVAAGGDGKIQVVLTKGALAKNLTSHNGSKGAMAVLEHLVDEKLIGLSDFRKSLTEVGKKYGINFKGNADTKSIHQDISDKFFGVKDSTFDKRGFFVNDIIDHLAQNSQSVKDNIDGIRDALNSNELGRKIKFARAGVVDSIGLLFSDEATIGAGESSVYATIEVSKPVVVKKGQHGSYPFHVRQEDGSRPILNIIKSKPHITDVVNDIENNPVPRNFENVKGVKMSGATKLGSNNTGWARGFIKSKEELSGGLKAKKQDLIADTKKKKFMTEDSNDNYVFFHYSKQNLTKSGIDPNKFGSNALTSKEEKQKSVPVSMYYTEPNIQETGTGNYKHIVRIPKSEVYPFNEDPLGLLPLAKKQFESKFPNRAFDFNNQIAVVSKLAAEKGYKMTVGDWGTNSKGKVNSLRAETPVKLTPELAHKPTGLNSIKINDKVEDFKSNRSGGLKAKKEEQTELNTTIHQSPDDLRSHRFLEKGKQTREIFSVDDVNSEVSKYTWNDINKPEQKYETTLNRVRKGGKYFWSDAGTKKVIPPSVEALRDLRNKEDYFTEFKYPDVVFKDIKTDAESNVAINFYKKIVDKFNKEFGRDVKINSKRDANGKFSVTVEYEDGLKPNYFAYPTAKIGEHKTISHINNDVPLTSLRHELIHEMLVKHITSKFERINKLDNSADAKTIEDVQRNRAYNYSLEDVFFERVVENIERKPDNKDTFGVETYGEDVVNRLSEEIKGEPTKENVLAALDVLLEGSNKWLADSLKDIFSKADLSGVTDIKSLAGEIGKKFKQKFDTAKNIFPKSLFEKIKSFTETFNSEYKGVETRLEKQANKESVAAGKKLFNAPNPETKTIAEKYKKDNGLNTDAGEKIYDLNIDTAKRIANAYEEMKHDPFNPEVKNAYTKLSEETKKQYEAVNNAGYKIEIYEGNGEPYANSQAMIDDLKNNKHLFIFGTESGFGTEKITDAQREENPLLHDSGYKDANGKPLLMNDLFRGVHDFFGHSERGNSFGAKGEENAWDVHSRMFTPEARRAMTTETRGQNSWVNFGKHNFNADGSKKEISAKDKPYAEQKIGLLPKEFSKLNTEQSLKETPKAGSVGVGVGEDKTEGGFKYNEDYYEPKESEELAYKFTTDEGKEFNVSLTNISKKSKSAVLDFEGDFSWETMANKSPFKTLKTISNIIKESLSRLKKDGYDINTIIYDATEKKGRVYKWLINREYPNAKFTKNSFGGTVVTLGEPKAVEQSLKETTKAENGLSDNERKDLNIAPPNNGLRAKKVSPVNQATADKFKDIDPQVALTSMRRQSKLTEKELKDKSKLTFSKFYKSFVKHIEDTSGNVKTALRNAGGEEAVMLKDIANKSGGKAGLKIEANDKKIFKGLSLEEMTDLGIVIQSKRIIQLDEIHDSRDEKRKLHPSGFTSELSEHGLDKMFEENPERYAKLEALSNKYFDAQRELLDMQAENGLLSQESYEKLKEQSLYSPRLFLQHLEDIEVGINGGKKVSVSSSPIKRLDDGSEGLMVQDPRLLLGLSTEKAFHVMAKNDAAKSLHKFATEVPDNGVISLRKVIGQNKNGSPIFEDVPTGMETISAMIDGQKVDMFMPKELAAEWVSTDPAISAALGDAVQWLTGANLLRYAATGANPLFALTNPARDAAFMYFTTDVYSKHLPKFLTELSADVSSVIKDATTRSGRYKEFIEEGGSIEYLTHQGRFSLARGIDEGVNKVSHVLGFIGETSELMMRLAMRERGIKNGLAEFKKSTGVEPTPNELKEIKIKATYDAINQMDFSQGGDWSKALNKFIPYLNAAVQGTRGLARAAKRNPKVFAYKAAQFMAVAGALTVYNSWQDGFEDVSADEKARNFIIMLPLYRIDDKGRKRWKYIKIAKSQDIQAITAAAETGVEYNITGRKPDKQVVDAIQNQMPPIPFLTSGSPTTEAYQTYRSNYDTYFDTKLWKGSMNTPNEEQFYKGTPEAYKKIGEWSKDVNGVLGTPVISPERFRGALRKIAPNVETNPFVTIPTKGFSVMFEAAGVKEKKEINKSLIDNMYDVFGGAYKRFVGETFPKDMNDESTPVAGSMDKSGRVVIPREGIKKELIVVPRNK